MRRAAEGIGLRWDDDHPSNHPYRAYLDGQLYRERTLVAVVELETKNPKQIRGALIDLITYPEAKKILVIGESRVIRDAKKMKSEVLERFLPAIHKLLHRPADIGVFSEQEVSDDAELIAEFLARPAPTNVGGG